MLRFLVVREIDCGNWLARGYMPALQHCDLFYPLDRVSVWVCHKLGNAPVPWSGTGSWVLSGQSGARHPLSPVIRLGLRNPRKKERNREQLVPSVVSCGNREQEQGTLIGLVGPRGRRRLKLPQFFLRCRSASESVFPGILDQIFRGFIDLQKCVFRRRSVKDLTN